MSILAPRGVATIPRDFWFYAAATIGGVHAGRLCIAGNASEGFTFRHADGTPYGQPLTPAVVDQASGALSALRHLGFGASHARALIDAVAAAGAPDDLEGWVRAALRAS